METATFNTKTLQSNQVNIGTLQNPNIVTSVPSNIKATDLSNGATPFTDPINNKSAQNNLSVVNGAVGNSIEKSQEDIASMAQSQSSVERKGLLSEIRGAISALGNKGDRTAELNQEENVFAKKQASTKLEGDYIAKQRAYDKQIEEIRKNSRGLFGGAVEQEINNLERQKNSELADIAIQYKIANGAYTDAVSIVDAKIKAEFEPLQNQITSLTNLYQLYADDLTESEKIQVQAKIQAQRDDLQFKQQLQRDAILQRYDLNKIAYQKSFDNMPSGGVISLPSVKNPTTGKLDPLNQIAQAINTTGLKNNEQLQAIAGVISATQQFANRLSPTGKVAGTGTFRATGALVGPQGQQNLTALEAINLNVQKWASGAALTDEQTKQVNKFTPRATDTNWQIRNKLNSLTNFMMSQAQGQFAAQGYTLPVDQIDFFPKPQMVTAPDGTEIEIID